MINTKRPGTDDYTQVGFIEAKDNQGNYQNIDHIYDSEGNIVFQQGYLNEYDGADDFSIPAIGKPLIDYTIYGNTFQDGILTPDNPIMPQGTGDKTGNLAPPLQEWKDGYIATNGYIAGPSNINIEKTSDYIPIKGGMPYTFSRDNGFPRGSGGAWRAIGWYTTEKEFISRVGGNGTIVLVTTAPSNAAYCRLTCRTYGETKNTMFNLGSETLPYEPYGYKIPIMAGKYEFLDEPLRAVKTYKDTIDLAAKLLTRQIRELVLTGEENWRLINRLTSVGGQYFSAPIPTQERTEFGRMLCSHYTVANPYNRLAACCALANYSQGIEIRINNPGTDGNIDAFKSYLASQYAEGTPITIWYVLTEPTTETISIPSGLTGTIEGVGIQNGTPTPDKPIMPIGKGERTRQIIEYPYFDKSSTMSSVQWTVSENGHIKGIGTTTSGTNFYFNRNVLFKAGTYTIKIYGKHRGMALRIFDSKKVTSIAAIASSNTDSSITFTLNSDTSDGCHIYFNVGSTGVDVDIDCDIMLNTGSTVLPYEPYGYKIPIPLTGQTIPIYLGEVESTRRIKKLMLTGEENWGKDSNKDNIDDYFYTDIILDMSPSITPISSHFVSGEKNVVDSVWATGTTANPRVVLEISKSHTGITSADDKNVRLAKFKSYLAAQYAAGTPVTVWYVLATEETAVVNDPLMRIGGYADSVDFSQAGVDIPTLKRPNTTVIDITTSLPPSEVYAKYRGSKTQKYDLFLAANGDSFEAKNGQSLYIGDDT